MGGWIRSWATRLLALVLMVVLAAAFAGQSLSAATKTLTAIALGLSLVRPAWSVGIAAALLPFSRLFGPSPAGTIDPAMMFAGAVVVGAFLRPDDDRGVRWTSLVGLGAVVAVSGSQTLWHQWRAASLPSFASLSPAIVWLEGLALAALAAGHGHRYPRETVAATRVLLVGVSLIALASIVEIGRAAAGSPHPFSAAAHLLFTARISGAFQDPNAAGSVFAAFSVAATWMWYAGNRSGRWGLVASLTLLALWVTGSRTAMASALISLVAAWIVSRRPSMPFAVVTVVGTVLVLSYLIFVPPTRQPQAASGYAAHVRLEMARVAVEIARQHPIFGVGVGNFQEASRAFISPELVATFPPAAFGENAHNNFLQILAELGVLGLAGFVAALIQPLRSGWRALGRRRPPREGAALCAGITAFLITCLAGHPLLIPSVTLVFLFMLGLEYGLTKNAETLSTVAGVRSA